MANPALEGLLAELVAERFGPRATPPPAIMGSTVEMLRRLDLCGDDEMADVIPLPTRKPAETVTSPYQGTSTRRLAASQ